MAAVCMNVLEQITEMLMVLNAKMLQSLARGGTAGGGLYLVIMSMLHDRREPMKMLSIVILPFIQPCLIL